MLNKSENSWRWPTIGAIDMKGTSWLIFRIYWRFPTNSQIHVCLRFLTSQNGAKFFSRSLAIIPIKLRNYPLAPGFSIFLFISNFGILKTNYKFLSFLFKISHKKIFLRHFFLFKFLMKNFFLFKFLMRNFRVSIKFLLKISLTFP